MALLQRLSAGERDAADDLTPIVYDELHRLAQRALSGERPDHTLQATALLNEAWIRLVDAEQQGWEGRSHFLGVAAKAMRSILVDHARKRGTIKRGEARDRVTLDGLVLSMEDRAIDLLALEEAMVELEQFDPELARIVELRFFGGLKNPEIASAAELPLRRVERGWSTARAWLYQRIAND